MHGDQNSSRKAVAQPSSVSKTSRDQSSPLSSLRNLNYQNNILKIINMYRVVGIQNINAKEYIYIYIYPG